jgi:hypothetical protein
MRVGTVYIAVDLLLASESGREKHVDLDEVGGVLFHAAADAIEKVSALGQGAAVSEVRFYGNGLPPASPVILKRSVGPSAG